MENKQVYAKPQLRKVRLEIKTSLLSVCNTTTVLTPQDVPGPGQGCVTNMCFTPR